MSTTFRVVTAPPHDSTPTDATSNNVQEAYIALDGQSGAESSSDELADDERLGPLGDFSDIFVYLAKQKAKYSRVLEALEAKKIIPTITATLAANNTPACPAKIPKSRKKRRGKKERHNDKLSSQPVAILPRTTVQDPDSDSALPLPSTSYSPPDNITATAVPLRLRPDKPSCYTPLQQLQARTPEDRSRSLLAKLAAAFPTEAESYQIRNLFLPAPLLSPPTEPLIFSFVDHSNLVYGFLQYLRSHPHLAAQASRSRRPRLDYHSFFSILERARPAARRVLVGSYPLHQGLESVQRDWNYEIHLLDRVVKTRAAQYGSVMADKQYRMGFGTDSEDRGESSDSDYARTKSIRGGKISMSAKEQAVDEVLHGKIYACLFENRHDLVGTTLVLATGDGAASEYSTDGFLGCAKAALSAGANVEVVAFRDGTSYVWKELQRRTKSMETGRLRIIYLDDYVEELLE